MAVESTKLQNGAHDLLMDCVDVTRERREQYEGEDASVFQRTADIYDAIFGGKNFAEQEIIRIFFCMKLARYGNQLKRSRNDRQEETIKDSLIDSNVYAALMEVERQLTNESEAETTSSE